VREKWIHAKPSYKIKYVCGIDNHDGGGCILWASSYDGGGGDSVDSVDGGGGGGGGGGGQGGVDGGSGSGGGKSLLCIMVPWWSCANGNRGRKDSDGGVSVLNCSGGGGGKLCRVGSSGGGSTEIM
jgi:hypothetical protein